MYIENGRWHRHRQLFCVFTRRKTGAEVEVYKRVVRPRTRLRVALYLKGYFRSADIVPSEQFKSGLGMLSGI